MGLIKLFSSDSPEPNPQLSDFKIIRKQDVGDYQIVEVEYRGCTTFGGRKLLLMRKGKIGKTLDPHLLGNGHPVIARFEPTVEGWMMAFNAANK